MKKVLGLDLGSASIGWSVISENENSAPSIIAIGSRILPFSPDDATEFTQGKAISKNTKRTQTRTQRKGYDRYQLRRENLTEFLRNRDMLPTEELIKLPKNALWHLRAKSVSEMLSLEEIGRVLYHLNQKRGYKSAREDDSDKSQREYVKAIMDRHTQIVNEGLTIGQFFYRELCVNKDYRIKEQVFPRAAYVDEFDKIINCQKAFYPKEFSDENISQLKDKIIYYQRKLKSCKHLVSLCEFEKRAYTNKFSGEVVYDGPKVAPKSSPIAQVCKIWESVNNITLTKRNQKFEFTLSQRRKMFEHLNNNEKLTLTDLYKILEIKKSDGWWGGKAIGKGLQGNTTKMAIRKALGDDYNDLLRFNLNNIDSKYYDTETGEIIQIISDEFQYEPLYKLWHLVYSIKDKEEFSVAVEKQFGITDSVIVNNLFNLDFVKPGYTNKSAKAMRRILPYLEFGLFYSDACLAAGFRHSESLSVAENASRKLLTQLKPIPKNELRQPIVEKILNQMINVVNALMAEYGAFDEIRVELARELKQSREERNETTRAIGKAERLNKTISERIAEYNLSPTRSRIHKYKMYTETAGKCFYCGQPLSLEEFLKGYNVEVEHIIPRSLFFDDSLSNKVCSCRSCNKAKNNRTAYDYMKTKSEGEFTAYLEFIDNLYKEHKISRTKRDRLLTPGDKIPTDFIDRQLRESQYIARKSREILSSVCRNVTASSGSITDKLRSLWGWDKVLHNLNFDRYKGAGLTEVKHREHKGKEWSEEVIIDWSKRLDHRHHAIDALVIACTKQGYIKHINDMSTIKDVSFKSDEYQNEEYQSRLSKLERYLIAQPHLSTAEVERAVSSILVSFKAGKKVATLGKRYIHEEGKRKLAQRDIVVPRGALHEDSIYGLRKFNTKNKKGELIVENKIALKYPLHTVMYKQIDSIIDKHIQDLVKSRYCKCAGVDIEMWDSTDDKVWKNVEKDVWTDLQNNPLLFNNAPIKSVRRIVAPLSDAHAKTDRGYVIMGNNHHIAIYKNSDGKQVEHRVTFWSAVERRKNNIPIVIEKPIDVWDNLPDGLSEEFLSTLPDPTWQFELSIQQNEMFILGLENEAFEEAMRMNDYAYLSKFLYRVQKISLSDYWFRLHIETVIDNTKEGKAANKFMRIQSLKAFNEQHPQKVYINLLGEIKKL
ncbi:MAG: type II CRISPR RNA-guided endonuclease Cas9 [Rikenellaceae bacterium]